MTKTSQNSWRDVPKERPYGLVHPSQYKKKKGLPGASCVLKGVQKRKTSELITVHKVEETTPKGCVPYWLTHLNFSSQTAAQIAG